MTFRAKRQSHAVIGNKDMKVAQKRKSVENDNVERMNQNAEFIGNEKLIAQIE